MTGSGTALCYNDQGGFKRLLKLGDRGKANPYGRVIPALLPVTHSRQERNLGDFRTGARLKCILARSPADIILQQGTAGISPKVFTINERRR